MGNNHGSYENLKREQQAFEAWVETSQFLATHKPENLLNSLWRAWHARAAQSAWISVEERLPEINKEVLVAWSNGMISLARHINDEFENQTWDTYGSHVNITHWQPLPEPIQNSTDERA